MLIQSLFPKHIDCFENTSHLLHIKNTILLRNIQPFLLLSLLFWDHKPLMILIIINPHLMHPLLFLPNRNQPWIHDQITSICFKPTWLSFKVHITIQLPFCDCQRQSSWPLWILMKFLGTFLEIAKLLYLYLEGALESWIRPVSYWMIVERPRFRIPL